MPSQPTYSLTFNPVPLPFISSSPLSSSVLYLRMLLGYHQQPNSTLLCGVCCTGPCFYDHTQGFLSDFCSSPCQVVYLEFQVHLLKIKQLLDRHPNLRRFTSEILPSFAASTPISPPLCSVCMSTASMYDFQQRVYLMLCVECSAKESPSVVVGNTGGEGSSSSMALSSSTRSKVKHIARL